ncbi:MAG: glycosyltransferase family 2 protein [Bacteroidota bacterium]
MLESSNPFVSIGLCTYNGSEFLSEQLNSILNQDYSNFEVVIVDDNSTDDTVNVIASFLQDPRIRFYKNDENLGYAANFAKALSLCDGELIALSDQDDIWLPEKLKLMVGKIDGFSGLYHNSAFMTEAGKLTGLTLMDKVHFVSGKNPQSLLLYNYVGGHTMMLKREVLTHALPIPKGIYHDWWLAFVCTNLDGLNYIEKPLVHYRIHTSNQTVLADQLTRINKADSTKTRRIKKIRKVTDAIFVLKIFSAASFISNSLRYKIDTLIQLERNRLKKCFSIRLFYFLLTNISIYDSGHRGLFGKINAMRKDSTGLC